MGGFDQFPNRGSFTTGSTQCGQNMPTGQPENSPSFQDGSNPFLNQTPPLNMYQPQMPMPQEKTGYSNEQYQKYVSKCLISFMLNKAQHNMQEFMRMQFLMQHPFMQNFQNNTSQNQPGGFSGTQTQMNTKVNEKDDKSSGKSPKNKQAPQKKSKKKSSNHGKLVLKTFANHLQCLYAFVTQILKKIKTMKVREKNKKEKKVKEKKLKEKKPETKKAKMMGQRLL